MNYYSPPDPPTSSTSTHHDTIVYINFHWFPNYPPQLSQVFSFYLDHNGWPPLLGFILFRQWRRLLLVLSLFIHPHVKTWGVYLFWLWHLPSFFLPMDLSLLVYESNFYLTNAYIFTTKHSHRRHSCTDKISWSIRLLGLWWYATFVKIFFYKNIWHDSDCVVV